MACTVTVSSRRLRARRSRRGTLVAKRESPGEIYDLLEDTAAACWLLRRGGYLVTGVRGRSGAELIGRRRECIGRLSQRQHHFVYPAQPTLPLLDDLRLEAVLAVAGHLDLDRTDLGQHDLGPHAVARVPASRARSSFS
jgi:hypothetical protein